MLSQKNYREFKFNQGLAFYSEQFDFLADQLESFGSFFESNGRSIHKDRNELKIFRKEDTPGLDRNVVIKSFKVPGFLSGVVYKYFRPSKARRSFLNSFVFKEKGFSVPTPLAFVEENRTGILGHSYFVSEQVEFDCTLHEVYKGQMFDWSELLPLVVEQAYGMHQLNMLHRDYSPGNVLIKKNESGFDFSYVDLNRLRQGEVDFKRGLKSFIRLSHDEASQRIISKRYAKLCGEDENEAFRILNKAATRHQERMRRKKKIKNTLGIKR